MLARSRTNRDGKQRRLLDSQIFHGSSIPELHHSVPPSLRVVIIDPSWNPADDLQAMDRAFRMGQTRDVNVYRLVAGDTIEEVSHRCILHRREQRGTG
jgi:hypothetical protein